MKRYGRRTGGQAGVGHLALALALGLTVPGGLAVSAVALAQDAGEGDGAAASGITMADPSKAPWVKFEAAIEKNYREPLKQGGNFETVVRDYLEKNVVPQLAVEDNRAIIERVRKRMRELLLGGITDDKAFESASAAAAEAMEAMARDADQLLPVRVNAMLFIGEMRQKDNRDGKAWPKAAEPLAKAAADGSLPAAVRIVAMAGLARQADTAKAAGDSKVAEFAKVARVAIQSILAEKPTGSDAVAVDWLTARALSILPGLTKNTPKELAATVAGILADESRPIDVRVRAAVALASIAGAKSEVDAVAEVKTVRELAVTALEAETTAADRNRFEDEYRVMVGGRRRFVAKAAPAPDPVTPSYDPSGVNLSAPPPGYPGSGSDPGATGGATYPGMPGSMLPGMPGGTDMIADYITEPACRRTAWRLHVLADAVLTEKGAGIGSLPGAETEAAKELAELLREHAGIVNEELTEQSVRDALAALKGEEPEPDAAPAGDKPGATKPAGKPGDSEPDPSSPFGN